MPAKKKTAAQQLHEKLSHEPSRVWDKLSSKERDKVYEYADGYRAFLNVGRTERRCVNEFVRLAGPRGFVDLDSSGKKKGKVFRALRGKLLIMAIPGKRPLTDGVRVITSHMDCPRLDLKPVPLYEDTDLVLLKTHYYGGVKKYQWVARSLAIVGTVVLGDGRTIDVEIGLKDEDPVFTIPDLLPHFARKQMEKKANEFIPGENLNALFGCLPYPDEDADERVKLAVLELLNSRYGITEEDFTSAELQLVPAEAARDSGIDRGLIAAYGQDDRICAYTSFTAILETSRPEYTSIAVFYDKEEIGSEGNTGAQSRYLEMFLMDLLEATGTAPSTQNLNKVLLRGKALSADVNGAFDPTYPDVFEKRNACRMGYGVVIEKYTGHGGKYMASDAHAEYAGWLRNLFNARNVLWQTGGFGKVDEGGGGTVAKYLARTGMDIIDVGPPLLSMHSPVELAAKEDVWMCHHAFEAFFGSKE